MQIPQVIHNLYLSHIPFPGIDQCVQWGRHSSLPGECGTIGRQECLPHPGEKMRIIASRVGVFLEMLRRMVLATRWAKLEQARPPAFAARLAPNTRNTVSSAFLA